MARSLPRHLMISIYCFNRQNLSFSYYLKHSFRVVQGHQCYVFKHSFSFYLFFESAILCPDTRSTARAETKPRVENIFYCLYSLDICRDILFRYNNNNVRFVGRRVQLIAKFISCWGVWLERNLYLKKLKNLIF